jgi:hypothetical protein
MTIAVYRMMILGIEATLRDEITSTSGPPEFVATQVLEARRFYRDASGRKLR